MKKILMALVVVLALTSSALAVPVYDYSYGGNTVPDIQSLFVDWGMTPTYDAVTSQTGVELWSPHAFGGTTTMIFAQNFSRGDIFGIYNSALTYVPLFTGTVTPPSFVSVGWNGNDVTVGSTTYSNFGRVFGYYFQYNGTSAEKVYSETWRNDGKLGSTTNVDEAFMLAFRGNGNNYNIGGFGVGRFGNDDWIIAGDYYTHGIDQTTKFQLKDFNDYVVFVSEAQPAVPEPATMLLLGSGLIGLAGFARKRFKK